jgi:hypothetical protein
MKYLSLIGIVLMVIVAIMLASCGPAPKDGINGKDGVGIMGPVGPTGDAGPAGISGVDGTSCTVSEVSNGAVIQCSDTLVLVKNGTDGVDGKDAPQSSYMVTEIIDPCGIQSAYDEVFLRFANGEVLAHYSDGVKQHFVLVTPGTWMTTDNTNCIFTVHQDLTLTW